MQPRKPKLKATDYITCERCEKKVASKRKRKYCEPCAKEAQTEAVRRWWRLNRCVNTKHTIVCDVCKTEVKRTGPRQRYCRDCSADVRRETQVTYRATHPNYHKERAARMEAARIARAEYERNAPLLLPEPPPEPKPKKETKP